MRVDAAESSVIADSDGAQALDLLESLLARARGGGADAADALLTHKQGLSVGCRLGQRETLERTDGVEVGLRVFRGQRQAVVSTSDLSARALDQLVGRALAMAAKVPEDPLCGLAEAAQIVRTPADVASFVAGEVPVAALTARALQAEAAALAVEGVTNSEGAEASWATEKVAIMATNGLAQTFRRSRHTVSVSVLAGAGTAMERDYEYAAAVAAEDLPDAEGLGRAAGERAVRRLNPRKVATVQVPVIFEPRVARSLLGHLATAINGAAVARGTTFLKDRLGQPVFADGITIVDDPLRPRGLRSRPFDGEGIPSRPLTVVDRGILTCWLTDLRSARQLGIETTGRAGRSPSSLPSPSATNLFLTPGPMPPEALWNDLASGFYVTELIGFGVNGVTGDYSRGATGFWIEGGELAYPVSEVTISGNLTDIYRNLIPASDLTFRYGIDAPTVRVEGLTVAGR